MGADGYVTAVVASRSRLSDRTVGYTATNESLDAITLGLDVNRNDVVLSIAGDYAYALLQYAAYVKACEIDLPQFMYFQRRTAALERGDFEGFLFPTPDEGSRDSDSIRARNEYFQRLGRLQAIRQNLPNLDAKHTSVFRESWRRSNKIYLSNTTDFTLNVPAGTYPMSWLAGKFASLRQGT